MIEMIEVDQDVLCFAQDEEWLNGLTPYQRLAYYESKINQMKNNG